jgi:hypothetical protein
MPPKAKKKRASLHLDTDSGQIKEADVAVAEPEKTEPPVRQVVEVVEEDAAVPEAIETIKKDAAEIEEVVETIEEEVKEQQQEVQSSKEAYVDVQPQDDQNAADEQKGSVESLFANATSPVTPEITVVGTKDKSIGVWVGAMLGIALAIGVSLIVLVRGPSTLSFMKAKPTPTPTAAPTPTPVPVVTVNRKDVKVSVINGGGTAGAGSKMKAFLEDKGYVVTSVSNAKEYTFTDTEIHVKSGKQDAASTLKEDLKSDYTLSSTIGTVDDSAAYDAQVIVGK